jgi:hypothetical protein
MHAFCKNMRSPRLLKRLVKETDEHKFSLTNWCRLSGRSAPNTEGTEMISLQQNILVEEPRSLVAERIWKSAIDGPTLAVEQRKS